MLLSWYCFAISGYNCSMYTTFILKCKTRQTTLFNYFELQQSKHMRLKVTKDFFTLCCHSRKSLISKLKILNCSSLESLGTAQG